MTVFINEKKSINEINHRNCGKNEKPQKLLLKTMISIYQYFERKEF